MEITIYQYGNGFRAIVDEHSGQFRLIMPRNTVSLPAYIPDKQSSKMDNYNFSI